MEKLKIKRSDEGLTVHLASDKGNEFNGFDIYIYPDEDNIENRIESIVLSIPLIFEDYLEEEMAVIPGMVKILQVASNQVQNLGTLLRVATSFLSELNLDGTCQDEVYLREGDHNLTIDLDRDSKMKIWQYWGSLKSL
jgi:hypothetical protein